MLRWGLRQRLWVLRQRPWLRKTLHTNHFRQSGMLEDLSLQLSTCSHHYKTVRNRTLGWMVPCSHSWNLLHHLLNCLFFFSGRWAVFTDCEHQGLLIFKHEGSCDLHLPYVLLLRFLGFKRNCVRRKLYGGKNFPTEGEATSNLPARHNNLPKFLSEVNCTSCTRHKSNLLIFSRVCICRSD